ncbi:MAG: carbon starvation protein A, partial [Acidobacteria bacterium]
GTTSKQIEKESHTHPVGYGAMLAEGFVAFIALVTIMIVSSEAVKGISPGKIYGNGIGEFLTLIVGKENLPFAITFGAMAFSTFVFDTLDVSLRLGRYIVQELTGLKGRLGALVGTLVTIAIPFISVLLAPKGSWNEFWTLFGASNQLLAALTLLSITVWLYQSKRRYFFTLIPMLFVLVITLWALGALVIGNLKLSHGLDIKMINGIASLILIGLAIFLILTALLKIKKEKHEVIDDAAPAES